MTTPAPDAREALARLIAPKAFAAIDLYIPHGLRFYQAHVAAAATFRDVVFSPDGRAVARAYETADAILAAFPALAGEATGGWRAIETAPRDGTPMLAASINHEVVEVVCWQDGLPSGCLEAILDPDATEEGWVNVGAMKDRFYANPLWFTHWMPLPNPPEAGAGKGVQP